MNDASTDDTKLAPVGKLPLAQPAAPFAAVGPGDLPTAAGLALELWRDAHLRDSGVSADTDAWNAIGDCIETIKRVIARVHSKGI